MKRNQVLTLIMIISGILLVTSILYSVFRERDPYKCYTGLGSEIAVSPEDDKLAFSYFLDGKEAIYTVNPDGTEWMEVSKGSEKRVHTPRYSFDGRKLAYLTENKDGIQSLMIMNADGSGAKRLSDKKLHVSDAFFSPKGDMLYFIAMPAEDFQKAKGETKEGYDLYEVSIPNGQQKQLTDKDHFTMTDLSVSQDGAELYYSLFDGNRQQLYVYSLDEKTESLAKEAAELKGDLYSTVFSDDRKQLAYTTVTEESKESSLFEYELFVKDTETDDIKRLTNLHGNIQSPVFFQHGEKIAFLHYSNWPKEPATFQLMTVAVNGEEEPIEIDLNLPASTENHFVMKTMDFLFSDLAIAVYYVLLLGACTVYLHRHSGKVFMPSYLSLSLAILIFISSFVVAAITNPWYGIGLSMIACCVFFCSLLLFLFALLVKKYGKTT
ncbi:hypothetical protein WQ54_24995 [Bacillus sp. SA1-12]|uniref:TolB family protein n=1 Tax=Bacillus sp. SA1-12 TaxID=1455638 RepID=UPI0006272420|nr:DUF5050 domain-containing protein [Bacillus sp. SA1-12]KKI89615.1 hypothetical protein WQ54_24995 [Bacillus sp. SA1-12]